MGRPSLAHHRRPVVEELESRTLLSSDWLLATGLTSSSSAALAADGRGNFLAVWSGYNAENGTTDVFARRLDSAGQPTGSAFVVNSAAAGDQGSAVVAAADNGGFVVVWLGPADESGASGLFYRLFDADGQPLTGDVLINAGFLGRDSQPAAAMSASGRFVVTWTRTFAADTDVYGQVFDAQGNPLAAAFSINGTFSGRQSDSAVAMDSQGNFVVAYQTIGAPLNEYNVFVRRFNSSGAAIGAGQILVPNTLSNEFNASVALSDPAAGDTFGEFIVTWTQTNGGSRIQAQRYFGNGTANGSVINVTASGGAAVNSLAGIDDYGRWVVVWQEGGNLFAQRFNRANGSPFDAAPVPINQSTSANGNAAAMVLGRSGGLMAWTVGGAAPEASLYANMFFPNSPVITSLSGDVAGVEGDFFRFAAQASDPNDDPITYAWDLDNDGEFDDAFGPEAGVMFADNGTYRVGVLVADDRGNTVRGFLSVLVRNADPQAAILSAPAAADEGDLVRVSGVGSDAGTLDQLSYSWSVLKNGQVYAAGSGAEFEFTPDDNGTYEVILTVRDEDGGSGSDRRTIVVANVPPQNVDAGSDQTISLGSSVVLEGSFTDPGRGDSHEFAWVVRDGSGAVVARFAGQQEQFTPAAAGSYLVTFTVTDDDGGQGVAAFTLTVLSDQTSPPQVDLVLLSIATPHGDDLVYLNYRIDAASGISGAVYVALYRSHDAQIDAGDKLLGMVRLDAGMLDQSGTSALAEGSHVVVVNAGQLGLPGDRWNDPWTYHDYFLLARLDASDAIAESNEANNDAVYSGVYRLPGDPTIYIHGTQDADAVKGYRVGNWMYVAFNGQTYRYGINKVGSFHVRLHGGDDHMAMGDANRGVLAWGGAGDDYLEGSKVRDVIFGGPGNDVIKGLGGGDLLLGGAGDDRLEGNGGIDLLFGGPGKNTLKSGKAADVLFGNLDLLRTWIDAAMQLKGKSP